MRFHYYAGLCAFVSGKCDAALTHYLVVLECADKLDIPYWQGLGNRAISNVYLWNCNYPEIVRYAKRALKYFQKNDSLTNNSTREYTDFMRWQLTFALSGLRKCDEAIALCNEGLRVAQIYKDSALRYDCTSEKATALYRKGNFREAARLYGQLCSITPSLRCIHAKPHTTQSNVLCAVNMQRSRSATYNHQSSIICW